MRYANLVRLAIGMSADKGGTAMEVEIRRLRGDEAREQIEALSAVLYDCVGDGASVGFMAPFSQDDARAAFEPMVAQAEAGLRSILAAYVDGLLVGTVQLVPATPPNQRHRADVAKLLVRSSARRQGVGRRLMQRLEAEARADARRLLVLDTVTGSDAERLYRSLGWTRVGVIPDYALFPDGRPTATTVFFKQLS